jgi:hypothetical protein
MYIWGFSVFVVYLTLFVLSKGEKVTKQNKGVLYPFVRIAVYLYRKAASARITSRQVDKALRELSPGQSLDELRQHYYTQKIGLMLCLLLLGTGVAVGVNYQAGQSRQLEEGGIISRSEYGDKAKTIRLEASTGSNLELVDITVPTRKLTKAEADTLEKQYWDELQSQISSQCAEDGSTSTNLYLETESSVYPFMVTWKSSRPELLAYDGRVGLTTQREKVQLTAVLTYIVPDASATDLESSIQSNEDLSIVSQPTPKIWEWTHQLSVFVTEPNRTETENASIALSEMLQSSQKNSETDTSWKLPDMWEGEKIQWKEKPENFSPWILGMAFCATVLIYFLSDQDLQEKVNLRRQCMQEAYPLIVNKLVLYLGAGMTLRGAYQKIAEHYIIEKQHNQISNPAYEEIVHICREIKAGVPENLAYEGFGKRSGISAYVKLNTLLIQNLKKGSRTLLERLRQEGEAALEEDLQKRRKIGEEAGTKLLIPMIMMLGVVMLLVMIPAFSSFGT